MSNYRQKFSNITFAAKAELYLRPDLKYYLGFGFLTINISTAVQSSRDIRAERKTFFIITIITPVQQFYRKALFLKYLSIYE